MQGELEESLKLLCEEAATEVDAQRLIALVKEINDILEAKSLRMRAQRGDDQSTEAAKNRGVGLPTE